MSDKPNTPVIIDDGEAITIKVGEITRKYYKSRPMIDHARLAVALAEEVIKLRNENDALKNQLVKSKYLQNFVD